MKAVDLVKVEMEPSELEQLVLRAVSESIGMSFTHAMNTGRVKFHPGTHPNDLPRVTVHFETERKP